MSEEFCVECEHKEKQFGFSYLVKELKLEPAFSNSSELTPYHTWACMAAARIPKSNEAVMFCVFV